MRLEHHLVGGYVRYISPYYIIIIIIIILRTIYSDIILWFSLDLYLRFSLTLAPLDLIG